MTATASAATPTAPVTIYYDGACPVCSAEIAVYQRQPGAQACTWVNAATCAEEALGPGLSRQDALARFHVRGADGQLVAGARGFAALWRALPRTRWLGRIAGAGPMPALLEVAYRGFLVVRRLWRPADAALPWSRELIADLRSDHAGEVGAVQIYRGVLALARDPALRAFAAHHQATEQAHLDLINHHLPAAHHSVLLPAWRVAGWLTGALPALFGPRAVYATIAAVETFVDRHYAEQVERIDAQLATGKVTDSAHRNALSALRADLERCRQDEVQHRHEAEAALPAGHRPALLTRVWTALVGSGSATAVQLARRI
jgi:3-demethoxyubiquinol 3-hydroxylase